jgi:hypothetical protein
MLPKILLDRLREFLAEPGGMACCGISFVVALALFAAMIALAGSRRKDDGR